MTAAGTTDMTGQWVFGGVDSHADTIHVAVVTDNGGHLADAEFPLDEARQAGGFRDGADPAEVPQLAFEFIALMELANAHSVLHDDPSAYERAGHGILARLRAVAAVPDELPRQPCRPPPRAR
ncbi:hypothetical protein AB0D54_02595 [Streptomyces xanthophaeus]|uniref:TetR family transcriptional regulator C-terminal domain-containing protein n=1 Tax=Streptomyces xanthophaeus TaxID=67385 RepID=UPI003442555A